MPAPVTPAPAAPATTTACRACGTWRCAMCLHTRANASRFSLKPQTCTACGSAAGTMLPITHHPRRADSHAESYDELESAGIVPRYPLGASS